MKHMAAVSGHLEGDIEIDGSWVTGHDWKKTDWEEVDEAVCACGMIRKKENYASIYESPDLRYCYLSRKFSGQSEEKLKSLLKCPLSAEDHLVMDIIE